MRGGKCPPGIWRVGDKGFVRALRGDADAEHEPSRESDSYFAWLIANEGRGSEAEHSWGAHGAMMAHGHIDVLIVAS